MTFIYNKYHKWYNNIIERARQRFLTGYYERHHIIPKSCGGPDTNNNRVNLTAREHYIAHLCLCYCTTGKDRYRMLLAVGNFRRGHGVQKNEYQSMRMNSRLFSHLREQVSHSLTERNRVNNPMNDPQTKAKVIANLRERNANFKPEWRQAQSESLKQHLNTHPNAMQGRKHSQETKEKIRVARLAYLARHAQNV